MTARGARKTNRDSIYREILDKIQYCQWAPGTPISETSLAELFQVSRTPVREALFLLSRDGFVDIYPQSGSYVSKIDIKRIREILYLRHYVEIPILMELAQKKTPIPEAVERLLLLEDFAAKKENWTECVRLDYDFHENLVTLADHREIWNLIAAELPHYTRYRFFDMNYAEFKGPVPRTLHEHESIMTCISAGDEEGLRRALDSHFDYTFTKNKEYKLERIQRHPDYFVNLEVL